MEWTNALSSLAGFPYETFLARLDSKFVLFWALLLSTLLLAIARCITSARPSLRLRALADHVQHGKSGKSR